MTDEANTQSGNTPSSAMVASTPGATRRQRAKLTKDEKRYKLKLGAAVQGMVLMGLMGASGRAAWQNSAHVVSSSAPASVVSLAQPFVEEEEGEESRRVLTGGSGSPSAVPTSAPTSLPTSMPTTACESEHHEHVPKGATALILRILGVMFIFVGIAIVCDEFFQPALEAISEALNLSADVAGATFLAAGSSAPELFTSLSDSFASCPASMGIGTIVGSAMFNILVIVALSCFVAGQSGASLVIDWRPVARDVVYYTISIVMLAAFFADEIVTVPEAAIMVVVYLTYILFMVYNEKIMSQCSPKISPDDDKSEQGGTVEAAAAALEGGASGPDEKKADESEGGEEDEEDEPFWHRFDMPDGIMDKVMYFVSLPFLVAFTFTIPDCDQPFFQNLLKQIYWVSFVMSILWIGILCHFMVEWAHDVSKMLDIDAIVVALVVLAVGTSIPDAIGSMVAAKNGEANMAIANAVGSNVFDILLGLGLPWFLSSLYKGEDMPVNASGIQTYVGILLATVILFVLILVGFGWKMNSSVGAMMFMLYVAFFIYCLTNAG